MLSTRPGQLASTDLVHIKSPYLISRTFRLEVLHLKSRHEALILADLYILASLPNPLLRSTDRPEQERSDHAEQRCPIMPEPDRDPSQGKRELDEFVYLIKIILALNVIFSIVGILI
jgi:hypothetical protein